MPHTIHRSIALVGLSGTGKSTVGRLVATQLGWPLFDTDELIIRIAGRTIPQLFAEDGEAHFRDVEAAALDQALAELPCVVATGAGVVLRETNRQRLRERAFVVWLDAPTDELVARLGAHDEERPLLANQPALRLEALRATRAALYNEIADLQIVTAGRTAEQICARILEEIARP